MKLKTLTFILIICLAQSFFVIPAFCNLEETSLSEKKNHCPLLNLSVISNSLILPETITIITKPNDSMFLTDIQKVFTLTVVLSDKEKPPQT